MVENDFGAYQASQEVSIISTNVTNTDTSWNFPHSPAKIPTTVCKIVKIASFLSQIKKRTIPAVTDNFKSNDKLFELQLKPS